MRSTFFVVDTLAEFYPHPTGTGVELAGRVRDLHLFKTSSGDDTCFFVLFDSDASVRVFFPQDRIGHSGEPVADGDRVRVRGKVRVRDGRKVLDAVEVTADEGGADRAEEATPDESAE